MDDPDRVGASFLLTDLEVPNTFLDIADTGQGERQERNIAKAWTAHNSIMNLASRVGLTDSELFSIRNAFARSENGWLPSRRDRAVNYCTVEQHCTDTLNPLRGRLALCLGRAPESGKATFWVRPAGEPNNYAGVHRRANPSISASTTIRIQASMCDSDPPVYKPAIGDAKS